MQANTSAPPPPPEIATDELFPAPTHKPRRQTKPGEWYPDLNPTQDEIFNDPTPYILAYGERGSGKTAAMLNCGVRHCYENDNALWLIVTPNVRTGKEGVLYDLEDLVLPAWKQGIGLDYTAGKLDPQTKDLHLWIGNRKGGWSKVLVISIPYDEAVEPRVKSISPSMVYVDELTHCGTGSAKYFRFIAQQLGRRRGMDGVAQQYLASCNPDGPSHWVYKTFWTEAVLEDGSHDPRYKTYHVPISENLRFLPPDYIVNLRSVIKDPIEKRRLIHGEWIDRIPGDAIFREHYSEALHACGDPVKNIYKVPLRGHPIILSFDPGPSSFACMFMQHLAGRDKTTWFVFDEVVTINMRLTYRKVVDQIMQQLQMWFDHPASSYSYKIEMVADEAAFNTRRPDGSFDNKIILDLMLDWINRHPQSSLVPAFTANRLRMRPCPKGNDSVPARVKLLQEIFIDEGILISKRCKHLLDSINNLATRKPDPNKYDPLQAFQPLKNHYGHAFDALTYSLYRAACYSNVKSSIPTSRVPTGVIFAGSG